MNWLRGPGKGRQTFAPLQLIAFTVILLGLSFTLYNFLTFSQGYLAVEDRNVDRAKVDTEASVAAAGRDSNRSIDPLYSDYPEEGEEFAELIIPKLDVAMPVFHGADPDELAKGVGHFAESVLPGMSNNSVLSGHRDTVFRDLGKIGEGDLLIVRTEAGEFTYKVHTVKIVDESDKSIIVQKDDATLTLTTCYPFNFIGYAPKRYVLIADLMGSAT